MKRRILSYKRTWTHGIRLLMATCLLVVAKTVDGQNYCTPTFQNVGGFYMGIVNFNMGSISNNTGQPNSNQPYNDYSTQYRTAFQAGSYVNWSFQAGQSNNTQVQIYIDWNNDKVFQTNEMVNSSGIVNANAIYNGGFQVPVNTPPGIYRMRLVGDYGSSPANNPCVLNYTGEVEDYTFIVLANSIDVTLSGGTSNLELGSNNISVQVANTSPGTTLTSYDIGYRIDNGTPYTETINGANLASGYLETRNFSNPLTISAEGTYTLKLWARNPNNTGAGINTNDTLYRTLVVCSPMSGVYTINPGGSGTSNFTSFTAAVNRLINCGVSGPVRFEVAAGTYTDQIRIPAIEGASATNRITFDGIQASNRILTYNTTDNYNRHVVRIDGAKYVEFRNLTIHSTGVNYSWPVHIKSNSEYIRFARNIIRSSDYNNSNQNTNFIPVVINNGDDYYYTGNTNSHDIFIDSNTIAGGYWGALIYGTGSGANLYEIYVRNNTVENFYYYGIYGVSFNNVHIDHNRVSQRNSTTTGGYGIYLSGVYATGNYTTDVRSNEVTRAFQYGIYMSSVNQGSVRGSVTNNLVGSGLVNVTSYGLYINSSPNLDIWHNTVINNSNSTGANAAAFVLNSSNNSDVRNNIFSVGAVGSTAYCAYLNNTSQLSTMDYNNYYKVGVDASYPIVFMNNITYSATDLKGAVGFNQNSVFEAPLFLSATNLRLAPTNQSPFGIGGTGVSTDIDGKTRCTDFPSMGASESEYITGGNAGIIPPDTVYVNSPATFYNTAAPGEPKLHIWTVDNGVATSNDLHLTYTFDQPGTYNIMLETKSCQGWDAFDINVPVVVPGSAPNAAFISTANQVDQGYPVQLVDQSTGGASAWTWSITPANGVQFVQGHTVQNPEVIFNQTGEYEVCLIASNVAGASTQLCKTAYIIVGEANNICGTRTLSRTASGKLMDQGGKFGDYSNGSNCGFLIDPCASSVTLSFEKFNLDVGDLLRVYDGADATGTPLHTGSGFSGTIIPADLTASTGKMYVQFISNSSGTRAGFIASWTSTPKSFNQPIAAFRAPDTLYTGTNFTFISNSTGTDATITWDFNNDQVIDASGEIAAYTFANPGVYYVRLAISDCGGSDGAVKAITVLDPSASPEPDFVSDVRTISPDQTVRFYDRSSQAPYAWEWKITPSTYTFVEGTDQFSQNPVITFHATGSYQVTLLAENSYGLDSIVKTGAIRVVEYCFPGAGLNADLGITRVTFAGIDHVSLIGPLTYSDYSVSVKPAAVQMGAKYPITIERATNNEDMTRKVWIDFDGNGVFGANELVAGHSADKSLVWTDSIQIPAGLSEGSTRMRIGTSYGITNNSACGVNPYGEFEDYTINIYENLTRPVITLIGSEVVSMEVGGSYTDSGATAYDDVDGNLTAQLISTTNLNTQVVGTYFYRYNVSDNNGNSSEVSRTIHVTPDITAPVLTLRGSNPLIHIIGSQFIDPGADATDNLDGVIPDSEIEVTGNVNSLQVGQYQLTYTVSDQAGNSTSAIRDVIVRDTLKPEIILKGADTMYIALGLVFQDPGAVVVDNNSGFINYQVDLSVINNEVVGDYVLTYTAEDISGNLADPVYRVVGVRDYTAPVLELLGDTIRMEVNTTFTDPGYTVSDNYDPQVSVTIQGAVDETRTGYYFLIYIATDASGNTSPARYRVVEVRDTKAPVITLNGEIILTHCRWEEYTDPGYVVSDNYDAQVEVEVVSTLNTNWEGLYSIRYTAEDEAGNEAVPAERLIRVINCATGLDEAESPVITVYPNPNNGSFTIESTEGFNQMPEIQLTDATGKLVQCRAELSGTRISVNLDQAAPGVYLLRVKQGDQWQTHKIHILQ